MEHNGRITSAGKLPAWQRWSGVVLTLTIIAGLTVLQQMGIPNPYPAPVIILALVYTALSGGLAIGMLATAATLCFTFIHFSEADRIFNYSAANIQRLIGYSISLPLITLMVGLLKRRADQRSAVMLDHSEARFRATFEQAAVGIVHVALDGHWLWVNQHMVDLSGYSRDELLASGCPDFTPPDKRDEIDAASKGLLNGDLETYTSEQVFKRRGGSPLWIGLTVSLVREAEGKPAYFITFVNDLTDRKQAEAHIQQQVSRAAMLAELSQVVTMTAFDAEQVLAQVVRRVSDEVGDGCVARLMSDDRRVLPAGIGYHVNPSLRELKPIDDQPVGEGLHGHVAHTGEAVLIRELPLDGTGPPIPPKYLAYAKQSGLHSLIIAPMRVQGRVIGTLTLLRDQTPGPYTASDQHFLQDVADRVALGVANARLFRDLQFELTERARAEAAVRESEQRYRLVARATNDVLWDWNVQTDHVLWNDVVYSMFRYDEIDVEPSITWWIDALHPADRERVKCGINAAVTGGSEFWSDEYGFRCGDGSYAVVLDRGYVVHDDNGVPIRMIGSMQDVTERRRAEQALAAEKERLAVTLASIGDAVISTDTGGRITLLNAAAENLTGWTQAEALGRPSTEVLLVVDEHSGVRLPDPVATVLRVQQPVELFKRAVLRGRDNREHLISDNGVPIHDVTGRVIGVVLVVRDITRRSQLEQQLQQAQKMESIGILAGGIAHDFNNILTGIIGTADLLLLDLPDDHPLRDDIASIRTQGDRGAVLTRQLLAFSRQQLINPHASNLNAVVQNVETFIRRAIGSRVDLHVVLAPELNSVYVDPPQIEQVLLNLCINARDAMPEGGAITITTANVELDDAFSATHVRAQPGSYVLLQVRDTGTGIRPETLQQIFEPFFTTKEPGKGTGLGLAMVYGIVQQHSGLIDVHSEPEQGTAFSLYFPITDVEPDDQCVPVQPSSLDTGETILVVEDEELVRTLIVRVLQVSGYNVVVANGGQEALHRFAAAQPPIDLVVLDLILPGPSGYDVFSVLRGQHPELKVLIVSNYAPDVIAQTIDGDATLDLLPKPFTAAELVLRVRAMLDRSTRTHDS